MDDNKLVFEVRGMKVTIDYDRCEPAKNNTADPKCGFACVKADRLYGRNTLKIENNRPVLTNSNPKELLRLCNECFGCEHDCEVYGSDCISIELSVPGLAEYRKKMNLEGGK
jgi:hypothetical protein